MPCGSALVRSVKTDVINRDRSVKCGHQKNRTAPPSETECWPIGRSFCRARYHFGSCGQILLQPRRAVFFFKFHNFRRYISALMPISWLYQRNHAANNRRVCQAGFFPLTGSSLSIPGAYDKQWPLSGPASDPRSGLVRRWLFLISCFIAIFSQRMRKG